MFHIYFLGSSEGLIFDVANSNFDVALWNPLRNYLEDRDVRVHTGLSVDAVTTETDVRLTCTTGEQFSADAVVLATDVTGLQHIVAESELGDTDWRGRVADLRTAPPFVVLRLWLDRPVRGDRAPFVGTGGRPPLDNVSVLERYEREAAQWAARTGGSVVELHAYSVTEDDERVRDALIGRLHDLYPRPPIRRSSRNVLSGAKTARVSPRAISAGRPTVTTPDPRIVLAGDGIRLDLPVALMERAATTGFVAANQLLSRFGLAGHAIHTVPNRGRSPLLRWLAAHAEQR